VAEERGLTRGPCPQRRISVVGEEGRQAGVVVTGGVGVVGGKKLGVASRGSENDWRSPTLGRCSLWQGTQHWLRLLAAGHGVGAQLGEELWCTGAEEPMAEPVIDRSRATM
jgi:hypothetical protein